MVILNSGTLLFLVLLAFAAGFLVDAAIGAPLISMIRRIEL